MAEVTWQPNPFEPASVYNAPQMLISQVLENEATASSLFKTIVAPNRLTPEQRETVFTKLKGQFGNNPVAGTLIDIATNPWVWLAFVTTPGAMTTLKGGGRLFGSSFTAFVGGRSDLGLMFQTVSQAYEGTPLPGIMRYLGNAIRDAKLEEEVVVRSARKRLIDGLNRDNPGWKVKSLDWREARNPEARKWLQQLETRLVVNTEGLDKTLERAATDLAPRFYWLESPSATKVGDKLMPSKGVEITDPDELKKVFRVYKKTMGQSPREMKLVEDLGEGVTRERYFTVDDARQERTPWQLLKRESKRRQLVVGDSEALLQGMGRAVVRYRDAIEKAKEVRFARLYLPDEMADRFAKAVVDASKEGRVPPTLEGFMGFEGGQLGKYLDETKLERIWRGLSNNDGVGRATSGMDEYADYSSIGALMSRDMRAAMMAGNVKRPQFSQWMRGLFETSVDLKHYMPRNTVELMKVQGGKLVKATESEIRRDLRGRTPGDASGRQQLREVDTRRWESDSLLRMVEKDSGFRPTTEWQRAKREADRVVKKGPHGGPIDVYIPVRTMDYWTAMDRYFSSTARDYALYAMKVPEEVAQLQEETLFRPGVREVAETDKWPRALWPGAGKVPFKTVMRYGDPMEMPPGGWSMADAIKQSHDLLPAGISAGGDKAQRMLTGSFLPTVLGTMHHEYAFTKMGMQLGQDALSWMMNGAFGRYLAERESLRPVYEALKHWSEVDVDKVVGRFLRAGASHLYTTHLGVPNFGSVVLNLTQPFHLAAGRLGARNVLAAYGEAMGEMSNYVMNRVGKYGFGPITKAERRQLYKDNFSFADEMGVQGHLLEDIDDLTFHGMDATETTGEFLYRSLLKPFEKAELLNRAVTAHATRRAYQAAGRMPKAGTPAYQHFLRDVEEMTARTQYGSGELNTPYVFTQGLFANPLMRMFLSFPTRTAAEAFALGGRLGKQREMFGGAVRAPWWVGDWGRMLGISSVIQAAGTNMLGSDLARYGAWSAATDLFRPGIRPTEQQTPLPMPPVWQIPWDMLRGAIGGDSAVMWNGIMRTVPGGVGLFKIAQNVDRMPLGLSGMQRTYVDWGNPDANGRVPVFKGTGELVSYEDPLGLVLSGLGLSMETHKKGSQIDGYMVQNREEINARKNEMLRAVASNNFGKAEKIRAQFQREFGYPLVVTQQQVKSYLRSRTVPRTERILDQMPTFARPDFARLVRASGAERLGLTDEEVASGFTAQKRRAIGERHQNVTIDLEELKRLRALVSLEEARRNVPENAGFAPPEGYLPRR